MPPGLKSRVAISLGALFALLCAFHIVGAFGVWDRLPVIPVVADMPTPQPSSFAWLAVAAALALAALVVLARADLILPSVPPRLSTVACLAATPRRTRSGSSRINLRSIITTYEIGGLVEM